MEKTNIKLDRGFISSQRVDADHRNRASMAIGDIVAGLPATRTRRHDGRHRVRHKDRRKNMPKPVNKLRIPGATYTEPEIGSVGLTEAKAKEAGFKREDRQVSPLVRQLEGDNCGPTMTVL